MRSNRLFVVLVALSLLVAGATAFAQGLPTATVTGKVLGEGQGLPGVTVTAKSPALQGVRTTTTGASGGYVFANIPPGEYTFVFSLSGFQSVTRSLKAGAAQQYQLDVPLSLTAVAAEATVVGKSESISQTSTEATTYTAELIAKLPTSRSIGSAVNLAPGMNTGGINDVSIAGAQSSENLYMINGVVSSDNIRNTLTSLYIEDAVQEVTTSTSSISAEYGRFVGGVINTITKSGGNSFSGSFRTSFANDSWKSTNAYRNPTTGANPQEGTFVNTIIPTYEATLGGPIVKDKVWFFLAGRYFDSSESATATTSYTNISYTTGTKEPRWEGKLTVSPLQNHTVTASYTDSKQTNVNNWYTSAPIMDLDSLYTRVVPSSLLAFNYNGVLSNSFFLDAQYSQKKLTFNNSGSIYTDLIKGTLLLDTSRGSARFNAPTFCGVCSPEKRDNEDWLIKGTYFLSTAGAGSHNIVAGYDNYSSSRLANNHQSGSDWRIYTTGAVIQGSGPSTVIYPIIDKATAIFYQPILQDSLGSDLKTRSGFVNDTWRVNNKISLNLGLRYDANHAVDAGGALTSDDSAWSPRLAAAYDVKGDGKLKATASYARYVAAISEYNAGSTFTPNGVNASFYWYYDGYGAQPINTGSGPYLSTADSLQTVWNWMIANGCNPANPTTASCKIPQGGPASVPGVNRLVKGSLASPNANEYTVGISGTLGAKGSYRADVVRRDFKDFYDLVIDQSTGKVTDSTGKTFDMGYVVNSSDYTRQYTGLHAQFAYRFSDQFNLGGNWTWSHLMGDIVGENATSGTIPGTLHQYPEYFDRKWSAPVGSLNTDQRHRLRLYGTYDLPVPPKYGALSVNAIEQIDTGTPYGAVGSVATRAYVTNPGYISTPPSVSYYFSARDAYRTEAIYRTDLGMTYSYKIGGVVEIYVSPIIYNVFNSQHIVSVNTTVNTAVNASSALNAFNPFTTAPVECPQGTAAAACKASGANWQKGTQFGQVTGSTSYQLARTFTFSAGIRF